MDLNGTTFANDGYIYKKAKRLRKWFCSREGWNHFWPALEGQMLRVEATYYKLRQRQDRHYAAVDAVVRKIMKRPISEGKYGPAWIVHAHGERGWKAYRIQKNDEGQWGYSYDWLDKKPAKVLGLKLGQELYRLDEISMGQQWAYRVALLLHDIFVKHVRKATKPKPDAMVRLTVHGRIYVYVWRFNRHGVPWPEKLCWPEDNVIDLTPESDGVV